METNGVGTLPLAFRPRDPSPTSHWYILPSAGIFQALQNDACPQGGERELLREASDSQWHCLPSPPHPWWPGQCGSQPPPDKDQRGCFSLELLCATLTRVAWCFTNQLVLMRWHMLPICSPGWVLHPGPGMWAGWGSWPGPAAPEDEPHWFPGAQPSWPWRNNNGVQILSLCSILSCKKNAWN